MAQILDLNKIAKQAAENAIKAYQDAGIPAQKPQSVTEDFNKKQTLEEAVNHTIETGSYKKTLIKAWKDDSRSQRNYDNIMLSEAIGAADGTAAIPSIWAKDVFRCCPYPASAFWDNPYIKWHEDLHNSPGGTLYVPTVGKAWCGTAGCAEPVSTAPTIAAATISMEEYQCSFYLCRNDMEDMVTDTVTELNNSLASCLDTCIDNAFIANLRGEGSTLDKGTAYITPAHIAEAIGSMRSGTCEPVFMVMHPAVEARLMQNSQFVNASTFGDRSVITGGHIIKYLGLDISVIPKGSLVQNAPGTYHTLMASRYAIHAAKKRDPTIESQYLVQTQRRYVYASVRFGKAAVCAEGVYWLTTGA